MLKRILDYAHREGLKTEPGFSRKRVKWAITVSDDGRITGIVPLGDPKTGRLYERCPYLSQPEMTAGRGRETRSQFLADSLYVLASYAKEGTDERERAKAEKRRAYYLKMLNEAGDYASPLATAARALNDQGRLAWLHTEIENIRPKPKPKDVATVLIGDYDPLLHSDWHDWWRTFRAALAKKPQPGSSVRTARMICLLTGEPVNPAPTHPEIKGLASVGGLLKGDVLISFNKDAFQSFGLKASANAAMDESTAKAYAETLNRLLAEQSVRLANTLAIYWFGDAIFNDNDPFAFLHDPFAFLRAPNESPADAVGVRHQPREVLNAIPEGRRPSLPDNHYYALMLSGAAGRVMVRDFLEGDFKQLVKHINAWFEHLAIVARDGQRLAPNPKFLAVAGALERELKDVPAVLMTRLWRAAITCSALPQAALAKAMLRVHAAVIRDEPANHARMGLIKAYHIRNQGDQKMKPYLNPDHPSPAYQSGRLLAVLSNLQRSALGDVGAGVVQRYYTAAAQTPALTLGRLIANSKNHLNKLERGLLSWYEARIAEIMGHMGDSMPRTLDLEQQSLFALGYYQQLATLRAGKKGGGKPESDDELTETDHTD